MFSLVAGSRRKEKKRKKAAADAEEKEALTFKHAGQLQERHRPPS